MRRRYGRHVADPLTEIPVATAAAEVEAAREDLADAPRPVRGIKLYRIRQQPRPAPAPEPEPEAPPGPAATFTGDFRELPMFKATAKAVGWCGLAVRGSCHVAPLPDYGIAEHLSTAGDETRADMQPVYEAAVRRLRGGSEWSAGWYRTARNGDAS